RDARVVGDARIHDGLGQRFDDLAGNDYVVFIRIGMLRTVELLQSSAEELGNVVMDVDRERLRIALLAEDEDVDLVVSRFRVDAHIASFCSEISKTDPDSDRASPRDSC